MRIDDEFWGYEYNIHIDAFDKPNVEVVLQQYFFHNNQIDDGNWHIIHSDDGRPDQPPPGTKNYPIVAGARLAFNFGMALENDPVRMIDTGETMWFRPMP